MTTKPVNYELMSHDDLFDALIKSIKAGTQSNPMTFEFDLLKRFPWSAIETAAFCEKEKEREYGRREMTEEERRRVENYLSQLATAARGFGCYPNQRELMAESWNISLGAGTLDGRMLDELGDPNMSPLDMAVMGCESAIQEAELRELKEQKH
jgi:hypothetical protein